MSKQLNTSSFHDLNDEYYEQDNSNPSHFCLRTYDQDDVFGLLQIGQSHLPEIHKHSLLLSSEQIPEFLSQPSCNFEESQENSHGLHSSPMNEEIESQSTPNTKQNESKTQQILPPNPRRSMKRPDDSNNAHKRFTTILNKACEDCRFLKVLKDKLKQRKISFKKASRESFIIRLIQIDVFFPEKKQMIQEAFKQKLKKSFIEEKNDPASLYLEGLKSVYLKAIRLFYTGDIIEATKCIYQIENAKEEFYKFKGIAKVIAFMKEYGYS